MTLIFLRCIDQGVYRKSLVLYSFDNFLMITLQSVLNRGKIPLLLDHLKGTYHQHGSLLWIMDFDLLAEAVLAGSTAVKLSLPHHFAFQKGSQCTQTLFQDGRLCSVSFGSSC